MTQRYAYVVSLVLGNTHHTLAVRSSLARAHRLIAHLQSRNPAATYVYERFTL